MIERPRPADIPDEPGSYQFRDGDGRVIYVGKARSLRSRLSSYFQSPAALPQRTAQMLASAESLEWIQVAGEVEALMLEYNLIKEHRPRFNVRYRDDKSYPYLALTVDQEWPRALVMRGQRRKGTRYFGPYGHAYAIRETLDLLLRSFPVRTCSDAKFARHQKLGRPCLLFHIEKCSGPCVGEVGHEDYSRMVDELGDFLNGNVSEVVRQLEAQMASAAASLEFEAAARTRDRLAAVAKVAERQQMVTERPDDIDVIGIAEDELSASVQVFFVRRGRVVGRKGFVVDKVEDLTTGQLAGQVLQQLYAEPAQGIPRAVLVPALPEDAGVYTEWLSGQRGSRVGVRVPLRGGLRALQETVTHNAREELAGQRLRRASDHNSRARALNALQDALGLPAAPLRIECYDMSHIQGSDYVGSMVVLEDGLPKKPDYRRFKVRSVPGNDDYAAMAEVLTRRLTALIEERRAAADRPAGGGEAAGEAAGASPPTRKRPRRFAYPPQLMLLDGGRGQLNVGVRVLEKLGLDREIPVAALAKQFEEVYLPGRPEPVRISRQSEALYLLQQVRDEAHRFAVAYHRQLRGKRMTRSALDGVRGLGPARARRLTSELGGVRAVRSASLEDLLAVGWLPDKVGRAVYEHLHGHEEGEPLAAVGHR